MAWYDDFPTSGGGSGLPTFQGFSGADLLSDLYGGGQGAPAAPAFANPLAGLYQNYTPAPMSSYPQMPSIQFQLPAPAGVGGYGSSLGSYSPFAGLGQQFAQPLGQSFGLGGQGYGGAGGGLSALQGYGGGQQGGYQGGFPGLGGGQQSLGGSSLGGSAQMPGYSPGAQRSRMQTGAPTMPQGVSMPGLQQAFSGGTSNPANLPTQGGVGTGQFASPLPPGGIYGAQKWSSPMGSNAVDIFVRRGTPVYAPTSGTLQTGANGQLILIGDSGTSFAFRHGQTTAQGHVQRGQQIGIVNDPGLDSLGRAPWGNMPDNYQHLEMSVSNGNYFPAIPGGGGSIDAAQWLDSMGYQGQKISKTPGPPDAGGGGMMGGLGGGMGGFPGMGGMGGGFPGMGGGMGGGFPGMGGGGFGGGLGGGMGGQMNPFGAMFGGMGGGGFGGGLGMGGFPGMGGMGGGF